MVIIRLARAGTVKRPFYHVVVADRRSPRGGRYTERMAYLIECLDPTRPVFKQIPDINDPAAA